MSRAGLALLILFLAVFVVLPVSKLVEIALFPGGVWAPEALRLLGGSRPLRALLNSLDAAAMSAIPAFLIGATLALALALTNVRAKRTIAFVFVLSMMISPQVSALAFKAMAGPASPLLQAAGLAPAPGSPNPLIGRNGVILVMALHHAPLAAVTIAAGLMTLPKPLIDAAMMSGATPLAVIIRVILPLLRPHLIAAAVLVFIAGIGNFGIALLLGLPGSYMTMPVLIFREIAAFGATGLSNAAVLSLPIAITAAAGALVALRLMQRAPAIKPGLELKPFVVLERSHRWALEGALWALIAATFLVPAATLLATSLVPTFGVPLTLESLTLDHYREVLVRQQVTARALRNSVLFSASAAVVAALAAALIAYVVVRSLGRRTAAVLMLLEIPYAIPGIVLGLCCILLFLKPLPLIGLSIYATPVIIVYAYVARFLPLAVKPMLAAMATCDKEQEEAAAVYGATSWQAMWRVVLPALAPAAGAAMLMVFLVAFNELTVSALLWTAGTETLGVALLSLDQAGLTSEAAAIGVTAVVVIAAAMLVLGHVAGRSAAVVLPWRTLSRS